MRPVVCALGLGLFVNGANVSAEEDPVQRRLCEATNRSGVKYSLRTWSADNGLPDNCVLSLYQSVNGYLWIETSKGEVRFDGIRMQRVGRDAGAGEGRCLSEFAARRGGGVWLIKEGSLHAWDGTSLHRFDNEWPLGNTRVFCLLEDRESNVWAGTSEGLYCLQPRKVVDTAVDPNTSGGWSLRAEEEATGAFAKPPQVVIEEGRLNGTVVYTDPKALMRHESTASQAFDESGIPRLELVTGDRLEFTFAAPSFTCADRVRFQYMLEGYDIRWCDPGRARVVRYQDLRPGSYAFRVKAANSLGHWNEGGAMFEFIIEPKSQHSNLMLICGALGVGGLLLAFVAGKTGGIAACLHYKRVPSNGPV